MVRRRNLMIYRVSWSNIDSRQFTTKEETFSFVNVLFRDGFKSV